MVRKQSLHIPIQFQLITTHNRFLDFAVGIFGFVPVGFFADFGEEDVYVACAFTACSSDSL